MKLRLVFVLLLLGCLVQAHELSFSYALKGTDTAKEEDVRGWMLNFVNLTWGCNDFSDYGLSINFNGVTETYLKTAITQAWMRVPLYRNVQLQLGKQDYSFGGSAFEGSC